MIMTSPSEHLVALAREHAERLERIVKDCTQAVGKLDTARQTFERVKHWQEWARILVPLLIAITPLAFILLYAHSVNCGDHIKFAGTEISRDCPQK